MLDTALQALTSQATSSTSLDYLGVTAHSQLSSVVIFSQLYFRDVSLLRPTQNLLALNVISTYVNVLYLGQTLICSTVSKLHSAVVKISYKLSYLANVMIQDVR
jgi:hypothetical protein